MKTMHKRYYELLEIDSSASAEQVKAAYRKRAKQLHPDLHPPEKREAMEAEFKAIAEAYQILGNPSKRLAYDNSLESDDPAMGENGRPDWRDEFFGSSVDSQASAYRALEISIDVGMRWVVTYGPSKFRLSPQQTEDYLNVHLHRRNETQRIMGIQVPPSIAFSFPKSPAGKAIAEAVMAVFEPPSTPVRRSHKRTPAVTSQYNVQTQSTESNYMLLVTGSRTSTIADLTARLNEKFIAPNSYSGLEIPALLQTRGTPVRR